MDISFDNGIPVKWIPVLRVLTDLFFVHFHGWLTSPRGPCVLSIPFRHDTRARHTAHTQSDPGEGEQIGAVVRVELVRRAEGARRLAG